MLGGGTKATSVEVGAKGFSGVSECQCGAHQRAKFLKSALGRAGNCICIVKLLYYNFNTFGKLYIDAKLYSIVYSKNLTYRNITTAQSARNKVEQILAPWSKL